MRCHPERTPKKDLASWSDAELLVAARVGDEDLGSLDMLVRRHARALERRCLSLTLDRERAADLAQETWTRMLAARATVRPEGSFGAFLATIAVNLWRDTCRVDRRLRPLSEPRPLSIDASHHADESYSLEETISASELPEEKLLLQMDLAHALARLPARLRAVVLARYVVGESASEIGLRFGRTEQTITAWLREAVTQLKHDLREWRSAA